MDVIERATHKNALFRYKSAQAFWRAVESAAGPGGVSKRPDAELSVLLAHHRAAGGSTPNPAAAATVPASLSERQPAHTYPEMISQLAEAKRKVKPVRPVELDPGSDFAPPAAPDADAFYAAVVAAPAAPLALPPLAAPHPDPVAAPASDSSPPVAPPAPVPVIPRADVVVLERKSIEPAPPPVPAMSDRPAAAPAAPRIADPAEPLRHGPPSPVAALVLITIIVCVAAVVLARLLPAWPAAVGVAPLAAMAICFGYLLTRSR
jgi:hypothetical protein